MSEQPTRSAHLVIRGARENNLKNIDLSIPRDQLVVITGLSGSGKSSLAFETIYAEGQRRFLESLSAYARRRVEQVKRPDVDHVYGLSPVVSIEQKTVGRNPRSTVGTMTDIYDYLRVLYTTAGQAHCPRCRREVPTRTPHQVAEHLLALPEGTAVELCAPLVKVYGEDYGFLFAEVRARGARRVYVDDARHDLSEELELDEGRVYALEAVVDRFVVRHARHQERKRDMRDDIEGQVVAAVTQALRLGESFLRVRVEPPAGAAPIDMNSFAAGFCCPEHQTLMGETLPFYFSFNDPDSACRSCGGLGTYFRVHPHLLVPHPERSLREGCFVPEAFEYNKDGWYTKVIVSAAARYGFSLDTPWRELPAEVQELVLRGSKGERFPIVMPEGAKSRDNTGMMVRFEGIVNNIERRYKHFRQQQVSHTAMEQYLKKVMVEHVCPDCEGAKLKPQRLLITLAGKNIYELGELSLAELRGLLDSIQLPERRRQAGAQVVEEVAARLDLLLGIGVDYLSLNRRATTLSGGESQRVRLSTQIGSGLMGMLYVLDEPSIGLHPKDNARMIRTLQRLRDIGNTVIVVEHDEETIRSADYIVEMGPGPGVHGGAVVAQGGADAIMAAANSPTGKYLSGQLRIAVPERRRRKTGRELRIVGASENNLKHLTIGIPLGQLVCVTGASGSGKSSLVNAILYKGLQSMLHDSRILPGKHERIEGAAQIGAVINIDQAPIGRTPRSNPATYIGFYDDIRKLFAQTPEARERGYTAARFSFNVKGGRCEECAGEGMTTTSLQFMPDVESPCLACRGSRYNDETLEVRYNGLSIAEVLDLTVEEGVEFFKDRRATARKIGVLHELGLGYLRLGQSSTTLSGGEAQRIKLAAELGKLKGGGHNLYILDEPTTGLHLADIQRLLDSLGRLVDAGNTVLVIEHHLDVVKTADHVIDLGPEGGAAGGELLVAGTPEDVARCERSHTGRFLRELL
jgi:excinuclease ABC subunit A